MNASPGPDATRPLPGESGGDDDDVTGPAETRGRAALGSVARQGRSDLLGHLRDPLFWHAYVLLTNAAITAGLGMLYWLLVARLYPQAEVGRNATVIASITFVAGAAQLNLRPVLARFVPVAGRRTGRLLLIAYSGAAVAAVMLSLSYIGLSLLWGPAGPVPEILADPPLVIAFVAATVLWTLFAIQDGALIGFRATVLLAVENVSFSVTKILLAVAFAVTAVGGGAAITLSWLAPIAVAIVVIGTITVVRLLPDHVARHPGVANGLTQARIIRYTGGEYIGSLFALAFTSLVPVMVLNQAGPEASARFYIVWVIAAALQMIPPQMTASLTVDTARDPSTFGVQGRRMLAGMMRVLVPLVAIVVIAAPLILGLFGPGYADEVLLLRMLALAAIPFAVISLFISFARVGTHAGRIVAVEAAVAAALLGLTQALLPRVGLDGVGFAFLATYSVTAAVLLATVLRPVLAARVRPRTG